MAFALSSFELAKVSVGTCIRKRSYEKFFKGKKYGKVLECGCGAGIFSEFIRNVAEDLTAIDLNEELVKRASKNISGVTFVHANIMNLPFPDQTFDLVVAPDIVEHTPDPKKTMIELARVLKKNGTLVMSVPCQKRDYVYKAVGSNKEASGHYYLFDQKLLDECFAVAGFKVDIHEKIQRIFSALIEACIVKMSGLLYGKDTAIKSNMAIATSRKPILAFAYYWLSRALYPVILGAESLLPRSCGVEHFVVARKV